MSEPRARPPLPAWREALERVLADATPLPAKLTPITAALSGRVLTEAVDAQWDLPQRTTSMMDGYAVAASGLAAGPDGAAPRFELVGESAAGHPADVDVHSGAVVRISTGAVLPNGCDTVVPQEDTQRAEGVVTVDLQRFGEVFAGRWTRATASDFAAGDRVLEPKTMLGPADIAVAVSVGATKLSVHAAPRVAIVSTGDELVTLGTRPAPGQVVSSNAIMLEAAVRAAGGDPTDLGIAPDDPEGLADVLRRALEFDVVLTSGGISVGDHDLVRATLERLGCTFELHGVALRPGKPLAFARRGNTRVLALPGNPASTLVGFRLIVQPLLRRLLGVAGDPRPRPLRVRLRNEARGAGWRAHLLRARLHLDETATVLTTQVSGNLASITDADALVEVPAGVRSLEAGSVVDAFVLEDRWAQRRGAGR